MEIKLYEWIAKPLIETIDASLTFLMTAMVLLAIIFALYDFILATMRHQDIRQVIITKMLKYAFFLGILSEYKKIKEVLLDGFSSFALIFTGSEASTENIPDGILSETLKNLNKLFEESMITATPMNAFDILFLIIVYIVSLILLVFVLYKVLQAIMRFHIVLGFAIVFIPCFLFEGVRSVGEKFINAVFSAGIKLTVLLVIQKVSTDIMLAQPVGTTKKGGFLSTITFGFLQNLDLGQIISFLTVFGVCSVIILFYDKITSFFLHGSGETLTIGQIFSSAQQVLSAGSFTSQFQNMRQSLGGGE